MRALFFGLAAGLALSGCPDFPANGEYFCKSNADCPPGRPCRVNEERCEPAQAKSVETGWDCDNGLDDDRDGNTDCYDKDCRGQPGCGLSYDAETMCHDGRDDDLDGKTDCADSDCAGRFPCAQ